MNELVKYNSEMNTLNFRGFGKVDMNLLMSLCSKLKNKGTDRITISFDKIKELSNYTSTDKTEFIKDLERMSDRLMQVNSRLLIDGKIAKFVLFPTFIIDPEKETLTVAVNKEFSYILNELEEYTIFELEEFVGLNSKYSKTLYRLLKQYRGKGKYEFHSITGFRELLDVPASYTSRQLMQRCVAPCIEEISALDKSFKDFKCEPKYANKRGKPLDKLIFTWQPERNTFVDWNAGQLEGQSGFSTPEEMDNYMSDCELKPKSKPTNKFKNCNERKYSDRYYVLLQKDLAGTLTPEEREEYKREIQKANESAQ